MNPLPHSVPRAFVFVHAPRSVLLVDKWSQITGMQPALSHYRAVLTITWIQFHTPAAVILINYTTPRQHTATYYTVHHH